VIVLTDVSPMNKSEISISSQTLAFPSSRAFAAILGLLLFLFLPSVFLGFQSFVFRDYGLACYPMAHFFRQSVWEGQIPLWNPYVDCGMPFMAQWNTLVLYPVSVFFMIFPLTWSLCFFCLIHLFLGGMGMFFLARSWTKLPLAAAVAGIGFAFSGLVSSSLTWPHNMVALGWFPWLVFAAERAWQHGGRWLIAASVIGALQMLSGVPELILLNWFWIFLYWLALFIKGSFSRQTLLLRLTLIVVIISLLTAAQLIPFFDLLFHSQRDSGYGNTEWAMPVTGLANLFFPLFYCTPQVFDVYFQFHQYYTPSYYSGLIILLLALSVALYPNKSRTHSVMLMVFLGIFLSFGDSGFLYPFLRKVFPAIGFMRYPVKFMFIPCFFLPLLAAIGLANFLNLSPEARPIYFRRIRIMGVICAGLVCFFVWWSLHYPLYLTVLLHKSTYFQNAAVRIILLAGSLVCLAFINRVQSVKSARLLQGVLLAIVWTDLATHTPLQNPTVSPELYTTPIKNIESPPKFGEHRAMVSSQAYNKSWFDLKDIIDKTESKDISTYFVGERLVLSGNLNLLDGIPKVDGFSALRLRESQQLLHILYSTNYVPSSNLQDFLSVSHVTEPGKLFNWIARTNPMPMVTCGQEPLFIDENASLASILDDTFDPRAQVVLSKEIKANVTASRVQDAKILSQHFKNQRVELEVDAPQPCLVVISQAYYHPWKARIDGQQTSLWRANHAFQAFQAPAGRHKIILTYEDNGFRIGIALSIITCAGLIIWFWFLKKPMPTAA